jgi:acetyltransferase-like isoleucine patch superfamily enzyme
MRFLAIILSVTPSFIHIFIRKLMGASIGSGTKIKFGTIILSRKIELGKKVKIGPFSYISSSELYIGNNTMVKPLSVVSARKIILGQHVHISPLSIINGDHTERSIFQVGDHSRFFPFCWVDTGEGVIIGKGVGVGGHTLIFTHGVWSDYLDGGPVSYGPVNIEDNVWLPWRVFVMPNVTIGKNAIIGANSTVNKNIASNVVAAGSPAKQVKENAFENLSEENKLDRAKQILTEYANHLSFKRGVEHKFEGNKLIVGNNKIIIDETEGLNTNDVVLFVNKTISDNEISILKSKGISIILHKEKRMIQASNNSTCSDLMAFLRKFGIRLYV